MALALLNIVLWPFVMPSLFTLLSFMGGRLRAERWRDTPVLKDVLLRRILMGNKLPITLWTYKDTGHDFSLYSLTLPSLSGVKQVVVVSRSWLEKSSDEELRREFSWILKKMDENYARYGFLKCFQMMLWFGQVFWLEMALIFLHYIMRIFGFEDLPRPAFWAQRLAWSVKRRWFGCDSSLERIEEGGLSVRASLRVKQEPDSWNYISFGVWGYYSSRSMHPTWRFLMDAESLIPS